MWELGDARQKGVYAPMQQVLGTGLGTGLGPRNSLSGKYIECSETDTGRKMGVSKNLKEFCHRNGISKSITSQDHHRLVGSTNLNFSGYVSQCSLRAVHMTRLVWFGSLIRRYYY